MVPKDADARFPMVPVDYVSAAVLALSRRPSAANRTFHLVNGSAVTFQEMITQLRASGRTVADATWAEFEAHVSADRDNALFPVIDIFRGYLGSGVTLSFDIDVRETERELAGTGITCPVIDAALFERYLAFFTESGYFPAP
jgi:nucleoside-diphosphate-sugar epimerase